MHQRLAGQPAAALPLPQLPGGHGQPAPSASADRPAGSRRRSDRPAGAAGRLDQDPAVTNLTALLFRGVRFTPGKVVRKDSTCWNCRGRMAKGTPAMVGRDTKARYLHPDTCAEAIA